MDTIQLDTQRSLKSVAPALNYKLSQNHFTAARYIFECGTKLEANALTISTACSIYHRFFKETDSKDYDVYLIGSTSLYLAGKVESQPLKLRDVINVAHCTLNRTADPLELGDEYWSLRDGIVQAELLVLRMLSFNLDVVHPHKFMLHYLKSLEDWIGPEQWNTTPIVRLCWSMLQDIHHDSVILNYKAQHIALAVINIALQCYGVQVPYTSEGSTGTAWYLVFSNDLTKELLWEIMDKIIDVYEKESELFPDLVFRSP